MMQNRRPQDRRRAAALLGFVVALALLVAGAERVDAQPAGRGVPSAGEPEAAEAKPAAGGKGKAAVGGKDQGPQVTVQRSAGGRKVFRIETGFVIEGRIQKPNAFYVLQRSQINYDWSQLNQDFTPRILESVRNSPF